MKIIRVVAAVIQRKQNGSKQIFATQRGYGEFEGGWEFPGGKIEVGETPQKALIREIKEELDADIIVGDLIGTIEFVIRIFIYQWTAFGVNCSRSMLY